MYVSLCVHAMVCVCVCVCVAAAVCVCVVVVKVVVVAVLSVCSCVCFQKSYVCGRYHKGTAQQTINLFSVRP